MGKGRKQKTSAKKPTRGARNMRGAAASTSSAQVQDKRASAKSLMTDEATISVVIATRNRCSELRRTLIQLTSLPEKPQIIVMDNASDDGTFQMVSRLFPEVRCFRLARDHGMAARTIGVEAASTPYVAFSDDDSWWEPGSLAEAVRMMDRYPRVAVLAARVLKGREALVDPASEEIARHAISVEEELPGPVVASFLSRGAIIRRRAYLEVSATHRASNLTDSSAGTPVESIFGSEALISMDLRANGWRLVYVDALVALHYPAHEGRLVSQAKEEKVRNELWSAWLRLPAMDLVAQSAKVLGPALGDREAIRGALTAVAGLPWILRSRRPLSSQVSADLRRLDS